MRGIYESSKTTREEPLKPGSWKMNEKKNPPRQTRTVFPCFNSSVFSDGVFLAWPLVTSFFSEDKMTVTIPHKFQLSPRQILEIKRKLEKTYNQIRVRFEQHSRNIVFECTNL